MRLFDTRNAGNVWSKVGFLLYGMSIFCRGQLLLQKFSLKSNCGGHIMPKWRFYLTNGVLGLLQSNSDSLFVLRINPTSIPEMAYRVQSAFIMRGITWFWSKGRMVSSIVFAKCITKKVLSVHAYRCYLIAS